MSVSPLNLSTAPWFRAKKTKGLRAKPTINLLVDRTVINKFLLDTLESKQPVSEDSMICIGEAGDVWQQTAKALLRKYDVRDVDRDGWMVCEPKPENEVQAIEITREFLDAHFERGATEGVVIGLWGEEIDKVQNCQRWRIGDFVCRQPVEHADVWVVARRLFQNTYSILGQT